MTEVATVTPHLERRFHEQRVVFWHDPDGQYASDLDSLDLSGTTFARREMGTRYREHQLVTVLRGAPVQTLNDGKRIIL
jgi:hypothetical protein